MCGREIGRVWERQNLWVDIDGCRTGSEGTTGDVSPPPRRDPRLRDSVGSVRRAATATAVAVNASRRGGSRYPCTDRSARAHTHVTPSRYRRRESGCEISRSGRRRREESVAERGSRAGDRREVVESSFDSLLATKKGLRHRAPRLRRRYSTVVVGAFGLLHREWREVAKEAVN